MSFVSRCLAVFVLLILSALSASAASHPPLVLAAASLQESMNAAAEAWAARGHSKPVLSFAASSALARQIETGAPADLFISADEEWMDDVQNKGFIRTGTRVSFLRNRLVLIEPAASNIRLTISPRFPLGKALGGARLALADPVAVPAGKYAKAALVSLGVWNSVETKLAPAENVRSALSFVERGEARLGIVYETDARASSNVRVIGRFPINSHPPISYPVALLESSKNADAEGFRRYLISPSGKAIFRRFGFITH